MIGNAEEARFIFNWFFDDREKLRDESWDFDFQVAPEGWVYLGEGAYRIAYLAPSGVVYKVEQYLGGLQSNFGEYLTWKRLYFKCKMPKHSRLPKLAYYPIEVPEVGVIAIERFHRCLNTLSWNERQLEETSYDLVQSQIQAVTGVGDLYGSNIFVDEATKQLVPTDLGGDYTSY